MILGINNTQVEAAVKAALLNLLSGGVGQKGLPSTTPTIYYNHGPGGLMSAPGLSSDIINAMVMPHLGLQSLLPSYPSNENNPLYGILTGVTAATGDTSGANANGVCEDPPYAGLAKLCSQSYVFGRQSLMTRVLELDRIGRTTNRGEFMDFRLIGNPFDRADGNLAPTTPGSTDMRGVLNTEIGKVMFELAVDWVREYAPYLYTGNPTNNSGGGVIKEYRGLDGLINTGYRDAESGVACAAADSTVGTFANGNISTNATNAEKIVKDITMIFRKIQYDAKRMGLNPARWVIAMRWGLFYELTEKWACTYATYRCNTEFSTSQVNYIDNRDVMALRNDMRGDWENLTGQYLLIDGQRVPVVIDDAIVETGLGTGAYESDIYFVPLTVMGGRAVTYLEYVDYDAPNGPMAGARALAADGFFQTTDGGRFLWHRKPPANFCVQALVKAEPRLILRTPQIAARLTNVAYTPSFHERSPFTDDTYFLDGGYTDRLGRSPSYFSPNDNVG